MPGMRIARPGGSAFGGGPAPSFGVTARAVRSSVTTAQRGVAVVALLFFISFLLTFALLKLMTRFAKEATP